VHEEIIFKTAGQLSEGDILFQVDSYVIRLAPLIIIGFYVWGRNTRFILACAHKCFYPLMMLARSSSGTGFGVYTNVTQLAKLPMTLPIPMHMLRLRNDTIVGFVGDALLSYNCGIFIRFTTLNLYLFLEGILMRVLITGAAGFLGSHLSERFVNEGHTVVGIDNLITGNMDNIAHLIGHERFEFIKHDVSQYIYVAGPVDAVLHFASPASPNDYLEYPIPTLKVGSLGTHNTLGLAKDKGARYLLASTSEVYGDPEMNPQAETYWGHVNPIGPRGVYDEAKRFAEAMTMAYHRYHGLDTRIVRIFNTYGPRMRLNDGRVVPNFISQALANEPLTVYKDGSQTRSFQYYSDLVEGVYRLLFSTEHLPVNIGNPNEMTILEFAHAVIEIAGSASEIQFMQPEDERIKDDPKQRRPDIRKAKQVLDWEPVIVLPDGLLRTINFFRNQI